MIKLRPIWILIVSSGYLYFVYLRGYNFNGWVTGGFTVLLAETFQGLADIYWKKIWRDEEIK